LTPITQFNVMNDMTNLLDPKQDYIFKNIFGTEKNKPLLISFLNALLFEGNPTIKSLTLDNPNMEKILEEDKASRLDIRATTDDKTVLDIEIQLKNTGEIPQRAFHYLANMMPHIVKSSESYKGPNIIGIWILGENVTDRQNAISDAYMTFQPSDPDPYQVMTDHARIIFIELPKFNPQKADSKSLLNKWLSFLKNPIFMDESFLQVKEVKQAMDTLKYISEDNEIRAIADLRQRTINDKNSEITVARDEGLQEGKARGLEEGKLAIAKSMKADGIPAEIIAKHTGLSPEAIQAL